MFQGQRPGAELHHPGGSSWALIGMYRLWVLADQPPPKGLMLTLRTFNPMIYLVSVETGTYK